MSWISVWTMLPPPGEPVLCRTHDGTAVVLKRLTNLVDGFPAWELNGVGGYEVEREWEDAYERGGGVTHWMPVPELVSLDSLVAEAVKAERDRAIDIVARHGGSVEIEAAIRGQV